MRPYRPPDRANEDHKSAHDDAEAALEASRRADADQLSHEEAEIEAAGMNQQPLPDVGMAAEVHATHPASLIEMGKGTLQACTAEPQQTQAPRPADTPTIAIHRVARRRVLFPIPSSPIRFGDVAAHAHGFKTTRD